MTGVNPRADVAPYLSEAELERHPWSFRCDRPGCYYGACAKTEDEADRERYTHGCPRTGGPMGTGASILERMWRVLDELMDGYFAMTQTYDAIAVGPPAERPRELCYRIDELSHSIKSQAQRAHGVCEMIAIVHHPHLADDAAVWAEAVARYQARQTGAYHATPGVSF